MTRGFSLAETVVALGLAAVVLSVSGQVMFDYYRLSRLSRQQAEAVDVSQNGMRTLCSFLRRARTWERPERGSANEVTFSLVEETPAQWLQLTDGVWRPQNLAGIYRVRLDGEDLVCTGPGRSWVLCSELSNFGVQRSQTDLMDVHMSLKDRSRIHQLVTRAL